MTHGAGVFLQRGEVLFVRQILSENQDAARFHDPDHVSHAGLGVPHVVEHVDHDDEIEVTVGEGQVLQRMIVEDAVRFPVPFRDEREFEFHVGADERVRQVEMLKPAAVEHEADVRVRAATHFKGVGHDRREESVIVELGFPPRVPVVPAIFGNSIPAAESRRQI